MKTVELIVIGAGCQGTSYANYALKYPRLARIVGVAEPREYYRNRIVLVHKISPENVYSGWKQLLEQPKFADAVIIATQDSLHVGPALAAAKKGYHILLEKPMATNEKDCRRIASLVIANKIIFAVFHVLRYAPYTQRLKTVIDSGLIGDIVSVQHLTPVGYWHQAHSYVRGNWRKEVESSSMLLAESCHDLDWLRYLINSRCVKISSFGTLKHFRRENKSPKSGSRCLECACEPQCPYSAKKIYLNRIKQGKAEWPVNILTSDLTLQGITEALKNGPYGRCVYECDNDVLDNQVVNMLFESGTTATLTVTGFNEGGGRKTRIFGTLGEIFVSGDDPKIEHFDFLSDRTQVIEIKTPSQTELGDHSGGDFGLMQSFITAVSTQDSSKILSGPEESLESYLMIFAAEKARRKDCVIKL